MHGNTLSERLKNKDKCIRSILPPFPKKNFLLEVTNFCNHKCIFCANRKTKNENKGFIDGDFAKRMLREAYELGVREVGFYATGEPLLNRNLPDYIEIAKSIGYEYTYITTNGALLTEEKSKEILHAGIDSIKFSINAGTRETYKKIHGVDDFDLVVKNLQAVSKHIKEEQLNTKLYISSVVTNITNGERKEIEKIGGGEQ